MLSCFKPRRKGFECAKDFSKSLRFCDQRQFYIFGKSISDDSTSRKENHKNKILVYRISMSRHSRKIYEDSCDSAMIGLNEVLN